MKYGNQTRFNNIKYRNKKQNQRSCTDINLNHPNQIRDEKVVDEVFHKLNRKPKVFHNSLDPKNYIYGLRDSIIHIIDKQRQKEEEKLQELKNQFVSTGKDFQIDNEAIKGDTDHTNENEVHRRTTLSKLSP